MAAASECRADRHRNERLDGGLHPTHFRKLFGVTERRKEEVGTV